MLFTLRFSSKGLVLPLTILALPDRSCSCFPAYSLSLSIISVFPMLPFRRIKGVIFWVEMLPVEAAFVTAFMIRHSDCR
jgi:hypothetical protein